MITSGEEFGFTFWISTINRSNSMNHILREEISAGRDHCLTSRQAFRISGLSDLLTLFEDLGAAGVVNGPINAAASKQSGVRGVDDRGYVLASDISNH